MADELNLILRRRTENGVGTEEISVPISAGGVLSFDSNKRPKSSTTQEVQEAAAVAFAVSRDAAQEVADDTAAALSFDAEASDESGLHEGVTEPTHVTITAATAGLWHLSASASFEAGTTGIRKLEIHVNAAAVAAVSQDANSAGTTDLALSGDFVLADEDVVEAVVTHTQGEAADVTGRLSGFRIKT